MSAQKIDKAEKDVQAKEELADKTLQPSKRLEELKAIVRSSNPSWPEIDVRREALREFTVEMKEHAAITIFAQMYSPSTAVAAAKAALDFAESSEKSERKGDDGGFTLTVRDATDRPAQP